MKNKWGKQYSLEWKRLPLEQGGPGVGFQSRDRQENSRLLLRWSMIHVICTSWQGACDNRTLVSIAHRSLSVLPMCLTCIYKGCIMVTEWRNVYFEKKFGVREGEEGRWVKRVGEKGCQTENTHLECFSAAEKWALLPRSIYYDTAYLKTIVKKKTAHYSSSNAACSSLLRLAGFVLHQPRQVIWFLL